MTGPVIEPSKYQKELVKTILSVFQKNKGLGAAVRAGLRECFERGADIGVMIDADGEYPAHYIPNLLQPIFQGEVDYTMGSRFMGSIKGMKLHRRLGNYCFTFLQSLLLRRWIYDGQSGMRAFTKQACNMLKLFMTIIMPRFLH